MDLAGCPCGSIGRASARRMLWLLLVIVVSGVDLLKAQVNSVGSSTSDSTAIKRFPVGAERQWLWGFGVGRLGLCTMNAYQKPTTDPPAMAAFIGHPEYSPGFFTLSLLGERNHRSFSSLTLTYRDQTPHFDDEYGESSFGTSKDFLARLSWAYYLLSPKAFDRPSFILSVGPSVYYAHRDYLKQYADTLFGFRSTQTVRAQILFLQVGPNFSLRIKNWMASGAAHFNLFGSISGNSSYDIVEHPGPIAPYREEAHFNEIVGSGFLSNNSILLNDLELNLIFFFK